jgi:hypothetical protein
MPTTTDVECGFPSCTRPVRTGEAGAVKMCDAHFREMEARGTLEDWQEAKQLLTPWLDAAKAIGHRELIIGMEDSTRRVDEELARATAELEEARAAL